MTEDGGLLLWRYTNTAEVKIEVHKTSKQVVFRSKAGKRLLVLPTEKYRNAGPKYAEQ